MFGILGIRNHLQSASSSPPGQSASPSQSQARLHHHTKYRGGKYINLAFYFLISISQPDIVCGYLTQAPCGQRNWSLVQCSGSHLNSGAQYS